MSDQTLARTNRNWSSFYRTLREFGPYFLRPSEPWTNAAISDSEGGTDFFWSEELMNAIDPGLASPDADIRHALTLWLQNVRQHFSLYGIEEDVLETIHLGDFKSIMPLLAASLQSPD